MITEIRIQNFKSIRDLNLKLGRVTVLIGENGSGKSNILEAIAFASGVAANKLDNEFLANRGIRVTEETWMRSAFQEDTKKKGASKGYPKPLQDEGRKNPSLALFLDALDGITLPPSDD